MEAILSPKQREQLLKEGVKQHRDPANDTQKITGLGLCLELGSLYLDQWRLDDASVLFTELEGSQKVTEYHDFGLLGNGMVLAFQNEPAKSNQKFSQWLGDKKQQRQRLDFLHHNAQISMLFLKALSFNKENQSKLPEALDSFSKLLLNPPRVSGTGKPDPRVPNAPKIMGTGSESSRCLSPLF